MKTTKELLPLGSVVYLQDGNQKLVIVGRGVIFDDENGGQVFADYMGVLYPMGFQPESTIFFQHDHIDEVVFEGYRDSEEERFRKIYQDWTSKLTVPRKKL